MSISISRPSDAGGRASRAYSRRRSRSSGSRSGAMSNPRGNRVAAEAIEQIAARRERIEEVESGNGAGGSSGAPVIHRHQNRRAPQLVDQARRGDAEHAGMPASGPEDDDPVHVRIVVDLEQRPGFRQDGTIRVPALRIDRLDPPSQRFRTRRVLGDEESQSIGRLADPPGRVEPGRQPERDVGRPHGRPSPDSRLPHEGGDARPPGPIEHFQPEASEHPVLVRQRRLIGDGPERDQVEISIQTIRRKTFSCK